jgi:hypothetical protein
MNSLERLRTVSRTLCSRSSRSRSVESKEMFCFPKIWTGSVGVSTQSSFSIRTFSAPAAAYNQTVDIFPSIVIGSDGALSAQGPFAESQAQVSG